MRKNVLNQTPTIQSEDLGGPEEDPLVLDSLYLDDRKNGLHDHFAVNNHENQHKFIAHKQSVPTVFSSPDNDANIRLLGSSTPILTKSPLLQKLDSLHNTGSPSPRFDINGPSPPHYLNVQLSPSSNQLPLRKENTFSLLPNLPQTTASENFAQNNNPENQYDQLTPSGGEIRKSLRVRFEKTPAVSIGDGIMEKDQKSLTMSVSQPILRGSQIGSNLAISPKIGLRRTETRKLGQSRSSVFALFNKKGESTFELPEIAHELIQDKAFVTTAVSKVLKKNVEKQESKTKLVKLLKRHANMGIRRSQDNNGFMRAVFQIRKMRMGVLGRMKYKLNQIRENLLERTRGIKTWLKLIKQPFKPDDPFRFVWDIIIMLFIIADLILLPFRLSFDDAFRGDGIHNYDLIQTLFFLTDILFSFNTAFYADGTLVKSRKKILIRYIKLWFWIDLISSFPYEMVSDAINDDESNSKQQADFLRIIKLLRFIKFIRVIRVAKLKRIMAKLQDFLYTSALLQGIIALIKLGMMIGFLAHWVACGWNYMAQADPEDNWLTSNALVMASPMDRYIASLYFAITTMLTVGYGDIRPENSNERVYSIFVMLLGGGLFGYTMNSIATIIHSLEDERSKTRKKISTVVRFMQKRGLAWNVQSEVKKYLEFVFDDESKITQFEKDMFESLSHNLKGKVYEQLNGRLLYQNKVLLKNFSRKLLYQVSGKIEEKTYAPEELIFDPKDIDTSLYFISKGSIAFYQPKSQTPYMTLNKDGHFGELAFFGDRQPACFAKSVEFSHLLFLKRERFLEALEDFPQDKEMFCMMRDNMQIYKDYSCLQIKCKVCNEPDHFIEICPKLRYIPDQRAVINQHLLDIKTFNSTFIRNNRTRTHPRMDIFQLSFKAKKICNQYPIEILEIKDFPDEENFDDPLSLQKGFSQTTKSPHKFEYGTETRSFFPATFTLKKEIDLKVPSHRLTVYNPTMGELELILKPEEGLERKSTMQMEMSEAAYKGMLDKFVFDQVKNYQVYFPHNNIIKLANNPYLREGDQRENMEALELRNHLFRLFKAIEKDKTDPKVYIDRFFMKHPTLPRLKSRREGSRIESIVDDY